MEYKNTSFAKDLSVDIVKIIYKYNFNIQHEMTPDDINQMLNEADANQMVIDMKTLENEIVEKGLENYILNDYLQKCTRRSLLRRSSTRIRKSSSILSSIRSSMGSILEDKNKNFNLNFQTRNELTRKLAVDKGRSIDYIEQSTKEEIKQLQGQIEELKCRYKDAIELENNFNSNFLDDEFDLNILKTATDRYLQEKFDKFTNNWLKSSKIYILRMRFIVKSLEKDCHKLHNELDMKSSYCGFLKPIDFIQLNQDYDNLKRDFDAILVKLTGIKSAAGLTSMMLNDIKKRVSKLESNIKYLTFHDERGRRHLKNLLKEATNVESRISENSSKLAALKEKFQTYIAPSVNQYAELKTQLVTLEKEEKILQRKIAIANIKFKNLKVKQVTSSSI